MKKYFLASLIFFCLGGSLKLYSQCFKESIFNTDSMGGKSDKLPFLLTFKIGSDSVYIYSTRNQQYDFLSFAIIEKQDCKWNEDFTEGYSNFRLRVEKPNSIVSNPVLRIIYEKPNNRRIELLYPNSEERVFTISNR
ncbi:hypothetical protein [Ferruginibacter sp. SUN106]|uniref:hypothetical protein n=1 Tax=Ferruginibacter sp. SUN106 TaxID=2978348 RepID=UPI003D36BAE0